MKQEYSSIKFLFLMYYLCQFISSHSTSYDDYCQQARSYYNASNIFKAIESFEKAQELQNLDFNDAFTLACCHVNCGNIQQAVKLFKSLLMLSPNNTQLIYNIGYTLKMGGFVDQAIEMYHNVLTIDPENDTAHFALGLALLYKGEFEQGWKQHERELKKRNKNGEALRKFLESNTLKNKIIVMHPEGGLGDTLMFIRYGQVLKELGATVVAVVQPQLVPLLSRCHYLDTILSCSQHCIPASHEIVSLMSLPAIFNAQEKTIPKNIPYVFPDKELIEYWKQQLKYQKKFNIGVCWQADMHNDSSRPLAAHRGIPLTEFYSLIQHETIQLYSLQKHDGLNQLETIPSSFPLHIFDNDFDDKHGNFMDTAAIMMHLDLIITVDTAIAHLAGSLGRPVWLLLPFATDWRWIAHRTDSPWYPTMKIFQQKKPFDWQQVMKEVHNELNKILQTNT